MKLIFLTTDNLNKVKREIFPAVKKNQAALKKRDALSEAAGLVLSQYLRSLDFLPLYI